MVGTLAVQQSGFGGSSARGKIGRISEAVPVSVVQSGLNVVITGTGFSFPDGIGPAVRVMCFARGLQQNGATVNVFLPKPTENRSTGARNPDLVGTYQGISFQYTCGQRLIASSRLGALGLFLKGLWRAGVAIHRLHRQKPVDAIILWDAENPINVIACAALAKFIGAVLIAEECEFPYVSVKSRRVVLFRLFNDAVTYKLLDGVIAISRFLEDYFHARLRPGARILRVPILVDAGSFDLGKGALAAFPRKVVYCGNLCHPGEVEQLIAAFAGVALEFPEWRLQIIGDTSDVARMARLAELVKSAALTSRVEFAGHRSREEIPSLLAQGSIMALPRAAGTFSTAGFPTKLGEYLASGRPVVTTRTGDIGEYLKDRVNAVLVAPGDTAAFSEGLRYLMRNPERAAELGERGRAVARAQFDKGGQTQRIAALVRELQTVKGLNVTRAI